MGWDFLNMYKCIIFRDTKMNDMDINMRMLDWIDGQIEVYKAVMNDLKDLDVEDDDGLDMYTKYKSYLATAMRGRSSYLEKIKQANIEAADNDR